ncbi:MAG: TolC family protein, partial [Desulfosarcina sp.]
MPRTTVCLMLTCALWVAAGWFGCASNEPAYRYDAIRTEYAGPACKVEKSRVSDASPTPCSVSGRLTLPDVIAIARANNPDLLMAAARIERAQAMLEKSTAPFYPRVSVYSEYLQGDAPSAYLFKTIDQRKLPPNT